MRYLALLGSINVGGNRIKMVDLKAALKAAGFEDVMTIGASGNFLFDHVRAAGAELEAEIAKVIADSFSIKTFAVVRSKTQLEDALDESPFAGNGANKLVHVMFLDGQPTEKQFDQLVSDHSGRGEERLALGTRALHIDYVDGVGDSRLTKQFIERRLGCRGTARNVNSILTTLGKFD